MADKPLNFHLTCCPSYFRGVKESGSKDLFPESMHLLELNTCIFCVALNRHLRDSVDNYPLFKVLNFDCFIVMNINGT